MNLIGSKILKIIQIHGENIAKEIKENAFWREVSTHSFKVSTLEDDEQRFKYGRQVSTHMEKKVNPYG